MPGAHILFIALVSNLFHAIPNRRSRERLAGMEYPGPAPFSELRRATQGTQIDVIVAAFHLQLISRRQVQLFPHGIRQYDPAEFINVSLPVTVAILTRIYTWNIRHFEQFGPAIAGRL